MANTSGGDDEGWRGAGRSLDPSGKLEGEGTAAPAPKPSRPPAAGDEPLELADRGPSTRPAADPFQVYRDVPKKPFRIPGWVWAIALLLIVGGAALSLLPDVRQKVTSVVPVGQSPAQPLLQISSTPGGATVKVGENELGETPVFTDNIYSGEIALTVSKKGYQTWRGTFRGGENVKLEIKLQPSKR